MNNLLSGCFNFIGSSHNAWHIGIVAAFVWMQVSLWRMMMYRKLRPCFPVHWQSSSIGTVMWARCIKKKLILHYLFDESLVLLVFFMKGTNNYQHKCLQFEYSFNPVYLLTWMLILVSELCPHLCFPSKLCPNTWTFQK